jgi:hypothetical protein
VTLERRDQPVLDAIVDYDGALNRIEHHQPGPCLLDAAGTRFDERGMSGAAPNLLRGCATISIGPPRPHHDFSARPNQPERLAPTKQEEDWDELD